MDQMIADEGFMVAFRYNMLVRAKAFAYKVTTDLEAVLAIDIRFLQEDIKAKVKSLTQKLHEIKERDNPYAIGGAKFGFDPKTGKPRPPKNQQKNPDHAQSSRDPSSGGGRGRGGSQGGQGGGWNGGDCQDSQSHGDTTNQWGKSSYNFVDDSNRSSLTGDRGYSGGSKGNQGTHPSVPKAKQLYISSLDGCL
ncbi:hypothetical protein PCANC_28855 [Puccinia coronata f. sp. avenae]|uniref:Uncharacterized protein n=1 Tax=Puccinia coronata f. sp. avenae TaxID=200324 RepID=A0A2N5S020_9BASI|nr:hypothetical protein PCANC_28855 [Puccinia coronata f. sp. avenae]